MKKFVAPEMEIEKFEVADVITASDGEWEGGNGGNNTGWN